MSYAFLLQLSRSAIKRIILIHRSLLTASVQHAKHQTDTAAFIHEQAVQAELKTLPEYK